MSRFEIRYILKNNSSSEGTYLIDGKYETLFPNKEIELNKRPTTVTENISITIYRKRVGEEILYTKPKNIKG